MGFPGGLVIKNPPANAREVRDTGLIPVLGRSPGGGNGNPLQYSCLGNPMDIGSWWATVHGVMKSWTWLSDWAHLRSRSLAGQTDSSLTMHRGKHCHEVTQRRLSGQGFPTPPTWSRSWRIKNWRRCSDHVPCCPNQDTVESERKAIHNYTEQQV